MKTRKPPKKDNFHFFSISLNLNFWQMKNSQILVLFLIGAVLTIIGAIFKISHERKDWTSFFLIIGMTFEAVAGIMLLLKLFKKNNNKDSFLDS
jgi:ABC-type enterobactin transport system permease subunit